MNRTRAGWLILALFAVLLAAWMGRYEYHCYAGRGCVAVNRFTGKFHVAQRALSRKEQQDAERAARAERERATLPVGPRVDPNSPPAWVRPDADSRAPE